MEYQLVLQFPRSTLKDFDQLIELEDALIAELGESAEVDGHDFGSGEMNIFIYTYKPGETFETIKPFLAQQDALASLRAAYRPTEGENYTLLWPTDSDKPFEIK